MENIIEGNIVDISNREIFKGSVKVIDGIIVGIERHPTSAHGFIMPGFIDAHVHVESSMLTPENFGQMTIGCGTVAVVADPHEIANVMGISGVDFMIKNSKLSPVKIYFTIPSCVPATPFDVSGEVVTADEVEHMAASGRFVALSEVMNVPGVLAQDREIMSKIESAKKYNLPIDGHAPSVSKEKLRAYINNNIDTDHECTTLEEAIEKIDMGMNVLIREGSAAHNYATLKLLIKTNPQKVMFCTDDAHPNEIITLGHIDKLVKWSISDGFDLFDVLTIACLNPIEHYKLDLGRLRVGDKADFIVVDSLDSFIVEQVYINGVKQYDKNMIDKCSETFVSHVDINNFTHDEIDVTSLKKEVKGDINVISLVKNELLTTAYNYRPSKSLDNLESDTDNDILKIVYINRYNNGVPQVAYCKGFHLKKGAFASSVAHDSHNILAIGCNDEDLTRSINSVIRHKGGLAVCCDKLQEEILPLPIAGIMSNDSCFKVALQYEKLNKMISHMGCHLNAPFMTLSFMSLVVIPEIKIGEKGLFCYRTFDWI